MLFGRQGAGKGTQSAAAGQALRRAAHLHRGHAARGGGRRHRVRPPGQAVHGLGGAPARRDHARASSPTGWPSPTSPTAASCSTASPGRWARPTRCSGITSLDVAVNIEVPREVVLERLSSRRVCTNCGAIYSSDEPPTNPWTCDVCGGQVVQRDDDTPEAIIKRLAAYERDTVPAIEHFGQLGLLESVDGLGRPDEVRSPHRGRHGRPRLEMRTLRTPTSHRAEPARGGQDARGRPGGGRDARAHPRRGDARGDHPRARRRGSRRDRAPGGHARTSSATTASRPSSAPRPTT